ncbi:hypothetical protein RJT34_04473 [Clitoria ternatea]|uniref:Uncharacterized protein n=1 Tax=Clitoria ternatea TaxID=43366 RepID=A0AAN9KPA3_CLITE
MLSSSLTMRRSFTHARKTLSSLVKRHRHSKAWSPFSERLHRKAVDELASSLHLGSGSGSQIEFEGSIKALKLQLPSLTCTLHSATVVGNHKVDASGKIIVGDTFID